jgi:hypothetical protein
MRKSQWIVFGSIFLIISGYAEGATPVLRTTDERIVIIILYGLTIACFINAGLEWINERKERQQKKEAIK